MNIPALRHPLAAFAIATLAPVPFLLLGGFLGASWLVPALLWLTVVAAAADRLLADVPSLPAWLRRRRTETDGQLQTSLAQAPLAPTLSAESAAHPNLPEAVRSEPSAPARTDTWDEIDSTIATFMRNDPAPGQTGHLAFAPIMADETAPAPGQPEMAPRRTRRRVDLRGMTAALAAWLSTRFGKSSHPARPLCPADKLSLLLAGAHLMLLIAAIHGLSGRAGYGPLGWIVAFFAFGLWFGQVSNANAHELIHRRDRRLRGLGAAVYATMICGHHTSAHRLVHHRFVATLDDPNTAQLGESFYRFVLRAWPGAFVAGYEMETAILQRRAARRRLPPVHPYVWYLGGALLTAVLVVTVFGVTGLLAWLLLAGFAQVQLLLSDYVQHYGLRRRALSLGKVEALGPRHSWDAPKAFSAALTLNAPHHADHHLHPNRPWSDLDDDAPRLAPLLPYSLPVMEAVALWPSGWRRLMDKRVKAVTRTT